MNEEETFAIRLQRIREKRRISRRVASELCGLDPGSFRRYERMESEPSARSLARIADEFNVSMDWLWGREKF